MAIQHNASVELAKSTTRVKPPPMYRVLLLNDDFTPMDFVIEVLQRFFAMDLEQATRVMLKVHTEGKGLCGLYARDIALTKAAQVMDFSQRNQHPLQCVTEEN